MNTNRYFRAINKTFIPVYFLLLFSCQHCSPYNNDKTDKSTDLSSKTISNSELEIIRSSVVECDENLLMYYEKFIRDLEIYNIQYHYPKEIIIELVDFRKLNLTNHSHGRSYGVNKPDLVEIYINNSSWKVFNRAQKYMLMYHELAHDILNLEDLSEDPSNKYKLMYPLMSRYNLLSMDKFIGVLENDFELIEKNQKKITTY